MKYNIRDYSVTAGFVVLGLLAWTLGHFFELQQNIQKNWKGWLYALPYKAGYALLSLFTYICGMPSRIMGLYRSIRSGSLKSLLKRKSHEDYQEDQAEA